MKEHLQIDWRATLKNHGVKGEFHPGSQKYNCGSHLWKNSPQSGSKDLGNLGDHLRPEKKISCPLMGVTMMRARSRVGSNGPPIHRFDAQESVRFWIEKGHQHAQTQSGKMSKVITRKKKEKDAKHTSKIFAKSFYTN